MKVFLGLVLVGQLAGCGDNSKACGPGTADEQGVCTGVTACGAGTEDDGTGTCVPDGSVVCASGTIFDAASGKCQIDPSACQDGTVPIGAACVDPTAGLTVDVEEGGEPNGFGALGEPSAAPAGLVTLKASGTTVIHGRIIPADHDGDGRLDADVDAYVLTAIGPTYLHVTAAGLHGLAGGFLVYAPDRTAADPLAGWQRFGVSLTGATSQRDVFLPAAGTYVLAITDARSLVLGGSPVGADANAPTFEYYASITAHPLPAATPLAFTAGKVVVTDALAPGEIKLYTATLGTGLNDVVLEMPPGAISATDAVSGSVVVLDNNALRSVGTERNGMAAETVAGGFATGDTALIAVDPEADWELDPTPFRLTITTSDATPLAKAGTAAATLVTASPSAPFAQLNWFYFDVAASGETDGIALSFNVPMDVVLVDQRFQIVAPFTWLSGRPTGNTMTTYQGLLHFPAPGRYYFGVYDPAGTPGASQVIATSQLGKLVVPNLVNGGGFSNSVKPSYGAFAFTYDAGTDVWDTVEGSGTNTGAIAAEFYPADNSFGRLDPLVVTTAGAITYAPDPLPLFTHDYPEIGDTVDRIGLDDPSTKYYVHLRPTTIGLVTLDLARQTYTDLATIAPGASVTHTQSITPPQFPELYLVHAASGARETFAVHPNNPSSSFDLEILDQDGSATQTFAGAVGADVTGATAVQSGRGWTALAVAITSLKPVAQSYTLTVSTAAP